MSRARVAKALAGVGAGTTGIVWLSLATAFVAEAATRSTCEATAEVGGVGVAFWALLVALPSSLLGYVLARRWQVPGRRIAGASFALALVAIVPWLAAWVLAVCWE